MLLSISSHFIVALFISVQMRHFLSKGTSFFHFNRLVVSLSQLTWLILKRLHWFSVELISRAFWIMFCFRQFFCQMIAGTQPVLMNSFSTLGMTDSSKTSLCVTFDIHWILSMTSKYPWSNISRTIFDILHLIFNCKIDKKHTCNINWWATAIFYIFSAPKAFHIHIYMMMAFT